MQLLKVVHLVAIACAMHVLASPMDTRSNATSRDVAHPIMIGTDSEGRKNWREGERGVGKGTVGGVAERAVLAEASLQAVISLFNNCTSNDPIVNKVMAHMSHNYVLNAPNVDALSTRLASQLTECALDIASQRSNIAMMEPLHREGELQRQYPEAPINPSSAESGFNLENQDAFAKGLLEETHPFSGREEGAFNFLLPLLAKALSVSKPLVSPAATDLVNQLAVHLLFQRALVADTALMALLSLPDDELKKLNITLPVQQKSDQREESIFDFIKTAIQKIGPFTLETAQGAIMRFAPILVEMAVTAAVTESGASLAAGQQQLWNVARYRNALVAMSPDRNVNPVSNADGSGGVPVSAVINPDEPITVFPRSSQFDGDVGDAVHSFFGSTIKTRISGSQMENKCSLWPHPGLGAEPDIFVKRQSNTQSVRNVSLELNRISCLRVQLNLISHACSASP
ncbi:hypothetical protein B0H14DRAFT_3134779 [Mycena olivaceomarginata]|nr:hypothetical protein B0H14DRAFT_3134779 [Mycena olivaceomarginata]